MDPRHVTLAEVLRNAGYRTAAFVSNFVLKPTWSGLDKGFDVYDARFPDRESNRDIYERRAQRTADDALAWLRKNYDERFFLWIHFRIRTEPTSFTRSTRSLTTRLQSV